ncbi:MAG: ATP-binding protein [Elsteraceae bacterium]
MQISSNGGSRPRFFSINRLSLRSQIRLLALTALAPFLALAIVAIDLFSDASQTHYNRQLIAMSRSLAAAIDNRISAMQAAMATLADSESLKRGDYRQFHASATESAFRMGGVILLQNNDSVLFSTAQPFGTEQTGDSLPKADAGAQRTPTVSDLFSLKASSQWATSILIAAPNARDAPLTLGLLIDPKIFDEAFQAQNYPAGWRAALIDRTGKIIARNMEGERFTGRAITADFESKTLGKDEGVLVTTTWGGQEAQAAFSRLTSGWLVAVGVERALLTEPLRHSITLLLAGAGLLLVGVFVLTNWWGRWLAASARDLIDGAEALGRGETPTLEGPTRFQEATRLSAALRQAGARMAQREAERANTARLLREQVATMERRIEERTEDLIKALSVATQASKAKSEFLANMSHELRTPLNAVIGFAQLLEAKLGKRQEGDYAGYIHQAGEQLHVLLKDILDLAKIESGHLKIDMEPTPLGSLFEQIEATMGSMAQAHGVTLTLPPPTLATAVSADPARLRQVLQNLISNAIKYNRPGGSVTIDVARQRPGRVRVYVSDTGTGIPIERQGELFQAFNRLGLEQSSIEGTGIGLAICRHLMTLMGGAIDFASAPGVGSQFWVELAEATSDADQELIHTTTNLTPLSSARRRKLSGAAPAILYIEDNAANLTLMTETLRSQANYQILTAETGRDGLAMAKERRPDAILLDIRLPDLDGFEVLSQLRSASETREIPVIAVSAHALPSDVARGLSSGFLRYLTKPFLITDLMEALTLALSNREDGRAAQRPVDRAMTTQYAKG